MELPRDVVAVQPVDDGDLKAICWSLGYAIDGIETSIELYPEDIDKYMAALMKLEETRLKIEYVIGGGDGEPCHVSDFLET